MKALQKLNARLEERRQRRRYNAWIGRHQLTDERSEKIRSQTSLFQSEPIISIIVPVYNTDERWLIKCIESVKQQIYPNWQLCIADDGSTTTNIRPLLERFCGADDRIRVIFREENGHISAASNSALDLADGEFIALLDHDDELSADALFWVVNEINDHPHAKLIYSDEDIIDERGRRRSPKFKPDLSRDLIRSVNYINHLTVYRRDVVMDTGQFRIGFEGSQDLDLLLRVLEKLGDEEVRHIPRVLYHWRSARGSVAVSGDAKSYAHENARRAIREHLDRTGIRASVEAASFALHRVRYRFSTPPSVLKVDPTSVEAYASSVNRVISNSNDTIVCFIDDDLESLQDDWLDDLAGFAIQRKIGVAGGRIIDRDDRVADGGLIVGTSQLVSVAFEGRGRNWPDSLFRNCVIGNYSAVSLSCMAMRSDVFREIGGFDANLKDKRLLAADICLRAHAAGYRVVLNPFVEFRQAQAKQEPLSASQKDAAYFRAKWEMYFGCDPFYNPNLSYEDGTFTIGC